MRMPDDPRPDTVPGNRQYAALAAAALLGDEAAARVLLEIDKRGQADVEKPPQRKEDGVANS